jgi:glucosamine kinase
MLFLGIDGGATRCRARIREQNFHLLGEAESGPANIHQDFAGSVASIRAAAVSALQVAGLPLAKLPELHAGLGLAGIVDATTAPALRAAGLPFCSIEAVNDAYAACLGAHGGDDGGIVITGTGSAAYVIAGGRGHAVGGWGFELGDDGSGAMMGRDAARLAVLGLDGMAPRNVMIERVLDLVGHDQKTITAWARAAKPGDYGRLAPIVLEASESGDAAATDIIAHAVNGVAALVRRLIQLGAHRIALLGGLAPVMGSRLPGDLQPLLTKPKADPLDGAIMLAQKRAGVSSSADAARSR